VIPADALVLRLVGSRLDVDRAGGSPSRGGSDRESRARAWRCAHAPTYRQDLSVALACSPTLSSWPLRPVRRARSITGIGGADDYGDHQRHCHVRRRDPPRERSRLTPTLINIQRPDLLVSGTRRVDQRCQLRTMVVGLVSVPRSRDRQAITTVSRREDQRQGCGGSWMLPRGDRVCATRLGFSGIPSWGSPEPCA
jgi:hypothetical protein